MNATFLNGRRLDTGIPAEMKPGDELRCGVVILRFEGARPSPVTACASS